MLLDSLSNEYLSDTYELPYGLNSSTTVLLLDEPDTQDTAGEAKTSS